MILTFMYSTIIVSSKRVLSINLFLSMFFKDCLTIISIFQGLGLKARINDYPEVLYPVSLSMEGILFFNKHLAFILAVLVLIVVWLLVCTAYHIIESQGQASSKSVDSKELEVRWLLVLAFIIASPTIFLGDCVDVSITGLEPEEPLLSEQEVFMEVNPLMYGSGSVDKAVLREIYTLITDFQSRGYSEKRLHTALWAATESFWCLEYAEKVHSLQEYFDQEDKKIHEEELLEHRSFLFLYVLFIFLFLIVPRGARGGR
jgi:hypothetical protein